MTLHLVYPCAPASRTPFAIGWELKSRLANRWPIQVHDHRARYAIDPAPGDLLLGHPTRDSQTVFNASLTQSGWHRRVCLSPFAPGDLRQTAHLARIVPHCDHFLAITGAYWMRQLPQTALAHLGPKTVHLDLAVDRQRFPRIKQRFNAPGHRRFLYIGTHLWYKNTGYLDALARSRPGIAWIGPAKNRWRHLERLGERPLDSPDAHALLQQFDFLLTVGRADANPTTILEAMAWGLIPVCTPQSGYCAELGEPGIVNVPLDDLPGALAVLDQLQQAPEPELKNRRAINDQRLTQHYHWDRFAADVAQTLVAEPGPACPPPPLAHRVRLLWHTSQLAAWHPRRLLRRLRGRD